MHVVATAGHVDHGKSTLVRRLTGMEPDRWAEERRRGMTIDLGFAWTTLPSGAELAFVDVPGHARFVGNMLAGVGPVPAVLFVVAADEGWGAQSAEHLAAIDALQVRHGVLAVTKADRADPAAAVATACEQLGRTSLGAVPVVTVSGETGTGLAALVAQLDRLVARLPAPPTDAPVRLWVDRCFTIRGAGTVVTGTLPAGRISVGDTLRVAPGERLVRVRSIQTLKRPADTVTGVARVAVNLRGAGELRRGDALVTPGGWWDAAELDVRVRVGAVAAGALVLHHGSAAVPVRVRPLGTDTARLQLAQPLPVHIGDRGLLRDPGRHLVTAGVTVLDPAPPALTRRGAARERARVLAGCVGTPDPVDEVSRRGVVRVSELVAMGCDVSRAAALDVAGWAVDPALWRDWGARLRTVVRDRHAAAPLDGGLAPSVARRLVGIPDGALLDALVRAEPTLDAAGGRLRPRDGTELPAAVAGAVARLAERLAAAPFAAPEAGELADLGLTAAALAAAVRAGRLMAVGPGIYLLPGADREAARRLARLPQPFTASSARQELATSRRVAIPLLEHLDRLRLTRRVDGEHREVVRPG